MKSWASLVLLFFCRRGLFFFSGWIVFDLEDVLILHFSTVREDERAVIYSIRRGEQVGDRRRR